MLIIAAFCPPDDVMAELQDAVAAAEASLAVPVAAPQVHKKWFGRSVAAAPETAPIAPPAPWSDPFIQVVRFGNVTTADARRVAEALAEVTTDWAPATVQFEQVRFGTDDEPRSVQAALGGDVAGLTDIAHAITSRAANLNFYLDRRLFHAGLEVTTAAETATAEDLMALTEQLAGFRGQSWTVDHFSVLRQTFADGQPTFVEEFAIPVGSA